MSVWIKKYYILYQALICIYLYRPRPVDVKEVSQIIFSAASTFLFDILLQIWKEVVHVLYLW